MLHGEWCWCDELIETTSPSCVGVNDALSIRQTGTAKPGPRSRQALLVTLVSPQCRPMSPSKNSRYSSRHIVAIWLTATQVLESIYADELISLYITSAIAPFAEVPLRVVREGNKNRHQTG